MDARNKEMDIEMDIRKMEHKHGPGSDYDSFPDDFYNPYPEQNYGPADSDLQKTERRVDELSVKLHQTKIDFQSSVMENECLKKDLHTQKQLLLNAVDEIRALKAKIEEMQDFSRFDAMIIDEE